MNRQLRMYCIALHIIKMDQYETMLIMDAWFLQAIYCDDAIQYFTFYHNPWIYLAKTLFECKLNYWMQLLLKGTTTRLVLKKSKNQVFFSNFLMDDGQYYIQLRLRLELVSWAWFSYF